MKVSRTLWMACVVLFAGLSLASAQTWTPLTNQPNFGASTALLLTDGTVMVHDVGAQDWWKLTPDSNGDYVNGTWSQLASLPSGYSPLYYSSAVLPDGRDHPRERAGLPRAAQRGMHRRHLDHSAGCH